MNNLLEDLYYPTSGLTLCEAKGSKYPGVIAVVEGPFGITESENRNKRVYTNSFWEGILSRDDVQSKIKERAMVGEPEHPNSLHARLDRVSHVITDLRLLPEEKSVWGRAEILDTPTGRILKTLFNAGVKVGISSRGSGSLTEVGGRSLVKEDGYILGGFDFVSEPSAQNAYPALKERLVESLSGNIDFDKIDKEPDLTGYYRNLLGKFGVNLDLLREGHATGSEDTTDDTCVQPEDHTITIERLQAQVEGLLACCKDFSLQLEEAEQRTPILDEERQNYSRLKEKYESLCGCLSALRTEKADLENALALAAKSEKTLAEAQKQHLDSEISRLNEEMSEKIEAMKMCLEKSEEEVEALTERLEASSEKVKELREAIREKNQKLQDFRDSLIENVCSLLQVDPDDVVPNLRKGFSPKDLVEQVRAISPVLEDVSLPTRRRTGSKPVLEVVDRPVVLENDGRPTPGPNFKAMISKS